MSQRGEETTNPALNHLRDHHQDPDITKWVISHYVYRGLHQPGYRQESCDNLCRELPRIAPAPLSTDEQRGPSNPSPTRKRGFSAHTVKTLPGRAKRL